MQLGVIGLGTMGANLARNAARNGATVAVYNRTTERTTAFIKDHGEEGDFVSCETYEDLGKALAAPRAILVMVKAGSAVDAVIEEILPYLEDGDILIDGGNSLYLDTERRVAELKEKDIRFLGLGVSGGEEGALHGPSMMPGGDEGAYKHIEELLMKMAADDGAGGKCVTYLGSGGAGHFVKMVHNGIEYGIMQLIAEAYDLLKNVGGYSNEKLAETFFAWNDGPDLQSYLVEITAKIFRKEDDLKKRGDLLDVIKDAAAQKGTGKWTSEAAMTFGVAVPTITAAVDARIISGSADLRTRQKHMPQDLDMTEPEPQPEKLRSMVRTGLELSIICAYAQGFELLHTANKETGWNIPLGEVARIWRGGCIIRSAFLQKLQDAHGTDSTKAKAAMQAIAARFTGERQIDWRRLLELTYSRAIPTPALSASLNYYDAIRKDRLPQNLTQAQRDFFGAHTYERTDRKGKFHAEWE